MLSVARVGYADDTEPVASNDTGPESGIDRAETASLEVRIVVIVCDALQLRARSCRVSV